MARAACMIFAHVHVHTSILQLQVLAAVHTMLLHVNQLPVSIQCHQLFVYIRQPVMLTNLYVRHTGNACCICMCSC